LQCGASYPKVAAVFVPSPFGAWRSLRHTLRLRWTSTRTPRAANAARKPIASLLLAAAAIAGAGSWLALDGKSRALEAPHVQHELLRMPVRERAQARVHRFRLPVARLHAEVIDLRYTLPLGDALGDAELVVNGGFWGWYNTKRKVIGLLASQGQLLSPLKEGLDGGVLLVNDGRASIVASRRFREPRSMDLAVQCRPRLLQAGKVVPDLNARYHAARTAVCVRESGRTLDVYVSDPADLGPSLYELGAWLSTQGCEHALNLDGGPSTAAAFRDNGEVVRIGPGRELPYALRFTYGTASGS
jgi:hypothetical protein